MKNKWLLITVFLVFLLNLFCITGYSQDIAKSENNGYANIDFVSAFINIHKSDTKSQSSTVVDGVSPNDLITINPVEGSLDGFELLPPVTETQAILSLSNNDMAKIEDAKLLELYTVIRNGGIKEIADYSHGVLISYAPGEKEKVQQRAEKVFIGDNDDVHYYQYIDMISVKANVNHIAGFISDNESIQVVGEDGISIIQDGPDTSVATDTKLENSQENSIDESALSFTKDNQFVVADGNREFSAYMENARPIEIGEKTDLSPEDIANGSIIDDSEMNKTQTITLEGNVHAITRVAYMDGFGVNGQTMYVAVLDTGLNSNHAAFSGRVAAQACFSSNQLLWTYTPSGTRVLARGVCGSNGATTGTSAFPNYDYWRNLPTAVWDSYEIPRVYSQFSHGSHVTGIAAGATGMASKVNIIHVNVFSLIEYNPVAGPYAGRHYPAVYDGNQPAGAMNSDILKGLEYVLSLSHSINAGRTNTLLAAVNLSLGGGQYSGTCDNANSFLQGVYSLFAQLRSTGVLPVVSSGNDGYVGYMGAPACLSNAFTVGALETNTSMAYFSNMANGVDIMAPGVDLNSALLNPNEYGKKSGTSMAAPVVTGGAAILKNRYNGLNGYYTIRPDGLGLFMQNMSPSKITAAGYTKPIIDFTYVLRPSLLAMNSTASPASLNLYWFAVTNSRGYRVYIGTTPNMEMGYAIANTNSAVINGLMPNTTYYIGVRPFTYLGGTLINSPTWIMGSIVTDGQSVRIQSALYDLEKGLKLIENPSGMSVVQDGLNESQSEPNDVNEKNDSIVVKAVDYLPRTGFAPNRVTVLQKMKARYMSMGANVRLKIPSIGVDTLIYGVPKDDEQNYDVSWLGSYAGWLADTQFPGRFANGNSVITGHVVNNLGEPGIFAKLETLRYGDQVYVEAFGERYTYQVADEYVVYADSPMELSQDADKSIMTLITCKYYDEKSDEYAGRIIVKANLVSVAGIK